MNLDASLSLDFILTMLAILGAVWRLESKIVEMQRELRGDIQRICDKLDDSNRCLAAEGETAPPS